jgi:hypothetical protein
MAKKGIRYYSIGRLPNEVASKQAARASEIKSA